MHDINVHNEEDLLKEIPSETLFLALKNASADITHWFFENAEPTQVRALIDLNCWESDKFLPDVFDLFFKNMAIQSPDKLADYLKSLDSEIWVRGLLSVADVGDFDPQNPPLDVPENELLLSPDSKYYLKLKTKDPSQKEALRIWLNSSSIADIDLQRKLLEACKWELISDLDEFQYQMKKGRLEELGFVDYFEAIALYAVGDTETFKTKLLANPFTNKIQSLKSKSVDDVELDNELDSTLLPDLILGSKTLGQSYFSEILNLFDSHSNERQLLQVELARTLNGALSADKLLPKSLESISEGIERSHSYLSLGLLILSKGQPKEAQNILLTQKFDFILRLGWLSVQDLVKASQALLKVYGLLIYDSADRDFLKALKGRHPKLSVEILNNVDLNFKSELKNFDIKSLLKLGQCVEQLGAFAVWVSTPEIRKFIGIPEYPFLVGESALVRLNNAIFRMSVDIKSDSFVGAPLSLKEWKLGSVAFNGEKYDLETESLIKQAPELLKPLLQKRIQSLGQELKSYLSTQKTKGLPDLRFFEALSFQKEQES